MDPELHREMWLGITDLGALWVPNVRELNEIAETSSMGRDKQTTHRRALRKTGIQEASTGKGEFNL